VSLKKSIGSKTENSDGISFNDLHVGDIVDGQVKRVESYGLFVTIPSSALVFVVITRLH
jgi:rRNA biogenesis protein RRP5